MFPYLFDSSTNTFKIHVFKSETDGRIDYLSAKYDELFN